MCNRYGPYLMYRGKCYSIVSEASRLARFCFIFSSLASLFVTAARPEGTRFFFYPPCYVWRCLWYVWTLSPPNCCYLCHLCPDKWHVPSKGLSQRDIERLWLHARESSLLLGEWTVRWAWASMSYMCRDCTWLMNHGWSEAQLCNGLR